MKHEELLIMLVAVVAIIAMTLAILFTLAPDTRPRAPDDRTAWITPDGMLYIQVERGSELLYFDSFNIAGLHRVAQSPSLQWTGRWEFRRE